MITSAIALVGPGSLHGSVPCVRRLQVCASDCLWLPHGASPTMAVTSHNHVARAAQHTGNGHFMTQRLGQDSTQVVGDPTRGLFCFALLWFACTQMGLSDCVSIKHRSIKWSERRPTKNTQEPYIRKEGPPRTRKNHTSTTRSSTQAE